MISPNRTVINQLIDFGLTEKEAVIYLNSLESGTMTAQQLSKNSGINRSSTYATLGSLIDKGLVGKSENAAGISVYEALEPDALLKEAELMQRRQATIHRDIDALIPELTAQSPALALHPRLKFYEGESGIETAMHDLSKTDSREMIRVFAVNPTVHYREKGQAARVISPYRGKASLTPDDRSLLVRYIPATRYDFSSDIRIYANKIVLISEREGFAAIIEDAHLTDVMRETFDLAWEEAGRLNAQIRIKK